MAARTDRRRSPFSHVDHAGRPKVGFSTPERAAAACRRLAAVEGWPQDVYQCKRCEHWHHGKARLESDVQPGTFRVMPDGGVVRPA